MLPATSISDHSFSQGGPEHLRARSAFLLRVLSEERGLATRSRASTLELVVDGYAHVLALDVDRRRLQREIERLAQSGDPEVAGELGELAALLSEVTSTSNQLRESLDGLRARVEQGT